MKQRAVGYITSVPIYQSAYDQQRSRAELHIHARAFAYRKQSEGFPVVRVLGQYLPYNWYFVMDSLALLPGANARGNMFRIVFSTMHVWYLRAKRSSVRSDHAATKRETKFHGSFASDCFHRHPSTVSSHPWRWLVEIIITLHAGCYNA